ncbi:MAG: aminopeptidase, partial [Spirochaetes bacterium]|nr:aminopeptidase [Spirochaetota bacterium]
MMEEKYLKRYAQLLADYCLSIKKDDKILIRSSYLAEDLINEFCSIAYSLGAHPETKIALKNSERIYYDNSSIEDLRYLSETEINYYRNFDAFLTIRAPFDPKELQGVSAEKKKVKNESAKILHELFSERSSSGTLKWCVCQYPTDSQATESGMSLHEYEEFIVKSAYLDRENPVENWDILSEKQGLISDYLNKCSDIRIKNDTTDISFSC